MGQAMPHRGLRPIAPLRALTLGEEQKQKIATLKTFAAQYPIPLAIIEGRAKAWREARQRPRDWLEYRIAIPEDYLITFTIEEHPPCRVRHLEVGIDAEGRLAPKEACQLLLDLFGFQHKFDDLLRWPDSKAGRYHRLSIHMVEPEDGDFDTYLAAMQTVENSPLVTP